ncbi:MAG TPA: PRC-barrel domain-containing protein [Gammaproteobacteria bacterium]|nr:PRC-barrel domain-containing protein [Gammaproteobacteria bacterium]
MSYQDYIKGKNLRATELVGERVHNAAGETLGEIKELVIPSNRDRMLVILSVGGLGDIRDKLVAVPYDDLRVSSDGNDFFFDRTEEQLKAAPEYSYDAPANQAAAQGAPAATARTDTDRPRATAPNANPAKAENLALDAFDYRASDLIGATVLDDRGEHVAKVDDIVVSTEDGKLHAVLAIGGFVGFGEKLISMPFADLQITSADDNPQVRIKMTGDQLQQLADSRAPFRYERQVAKAPGSAPRG